MDNGYLIFIITLIFLIILVIITEKFKCYKNKVELQIEVLDLMLNNLVIKLDDVQDWLDDTCDELGISYKKK